MDNNYYVYGYIRLDNNSYFYIGKGRNHRCYELFNRSKEFMDILNSVPCAVEIIYNNLDEESALFYERSVIEYLVFNEGYSLGIDNCINKSYNYLTNKTYGGSGITGYHFTAAQNIKHIRRGKDHPMYGVRGENHPIYNRKYSEDHKNKIRQSSPLRNMVYCKTLNITFSSYREAEKILYNNYGIVCSHASISQVCRGRNRYAGYYAADNSPAYLEFIKLENPFLILQYPFHFTYND